MVNTRIRIIGVLATITVVTSAVRADDGVRIPEAGHRSAAPAKAVPPAPGKAAPEPTAPQEAPPVVGPEMAEFVGLYNATVKVLRENVTNSALQSNRSYLQQLVAESLDRFSGVAGAGDPRLTALFSDAFAPGLRDKLLKALPPAEDGQRPAPRLSELKEALFGKGDPTRASALWQSLDYNDRLRILALLGQEMDAYKARSLGRRSPDFVAGMTKAVQDIVERFGSYPNTRIPLPKDIRASLEALLPDGRDPGRKGHLTLAEIGRIFSAPASARGSLRRADLATLAGALFTFEHMQPTRGERLLDEAFADAVFAARRHVLERNGVASESAIADRHAWDGIPALRRQIVIVPSHASVMAQALKDAIADGWVQAPIGSKAAQACPLSGDAVNVAKKRDALGAFGWPIEIVRRNKPNALCGGAGLRLSNEKICTDNGDGTATFAFGTANHCDLADKVAVIFPGFGRVPAQNIETQPLPGVPDSVYWHVTVPMGCKAITDSPMGKSFYEVADGGAIPAINEPTYLALNPYRTMMNNPPSRPNALAMSVTPGPVRGALSYTVDSCVPGQEGEEGGTQQGDSGMPLLVQSGDKKYIVGFLSTGHFDGDPSKDLSLAAKEGTISQASDKLSVALRMGIAYTTNAKQLALRQHGVGPGVASTHADAKDDTPAATTAAATPATGVVKK